MKKVVSFSGGRTSAYLCKTMIDKFGRENVDFVFMDTGAEHPKTYEFIKKVNDHFNLNLTSLRGDFSLPLGKGVGYKIVDINDCKPDIEPYKAMMGKYGVPYIGGMFCTDRMKLQVFKKYCNDTYGVDGYETWLGIRADEPARLVGKDLYSICKKSGMNDADIFTLYMNQLNTSEFDPFDGMFTSNHIHYSLEQICEITDKRIALFRKNNIHHMAEITISDKSDVLEFWSSMPFDLEIDEWLGNCVFCPKKSDLKLAAAQRDEPEMYHEFLEALDDESVRIDNKTGVKEMMYRGKKSLQQVVAMFDGSTGDEIKSRIRGAKMTDTNSCSESCEVFNDETQTQFDF